MSKPFDRARRPKLRPKIGSSYPKTLFLTDKPTITNVQRMLKHLSNAQKTVILDTVNHIKQNPAEYSQTMKSLHDWQRLIVGQILSHIGHRLLKHENFIEE